MELASLVWLFGLVWDFLQAPRGDPFLLPAVSSFLWQRPYLQAMVKLFSQRKQGLGLSLPRALAFFRGVLPEQFTALDLTGKANTPFPDKGQKMCFWST